MLGVHPPSMARVLSGHCCIRPARAEQRWPACFVFCCSRTSCLPWSNQCSPCHAMSPHIRPPAVYLTERSHLCLILRPPKVLCSTKTPHLSLTRTRNRRTRQQIPAMGQPRFLAPVGVLLIAMTCSAMGQVSWCTERDVCVGENGCSVGPCKMICHFFDPADFFSFQPQCVHGAWRGVDTWPLSDERQTTI